MRVLFIKLSSMGDIFHSYNAISDFCALFPKDQIDWLVDTQFQEVARWHQGVNQVFAVPDRAYRKDKTTLKKQALTAALSDASMNDYDLIIDAQGLFKSAFYARKISKSSKSKIPIAGFSYGSAREPLATLCYQRTFKVSKQQHAIVRTKQLMAHSLNYFDQLSKLPQFGLDIKCWQKPVANFDQYGMIFPSTTWDTKHWLDEHWQQLVQEMTERHQQNIVIGWGNNQELARAKRIAQQNPRVLVSTERLNITETAQWIAHSDWVIGVDTGFTHLASAMQKPVIGLFGPTSPEHTGVLGDQTDNLVTQLPCSPCRKKYCKISIDKTIAQCMQAIKHQSVIKKLIEVTDLAISE